MIERADNPQSIINNQQSEIVVLPDRAALAREAATRFVSLARDAMRARGRFTVALSGGSTPRDLYSLLATQEFSAQIDWARVHLFWSDERCMPPNHPDSNFKMANDALIARAPIPAENVHRIRVEIAPEDAAREYEASMRNFFSPQNSQRYSSVPPVSSVVEFPRFDLILLGLGTDAHTASLFPHTPLLRETQRWVAAQYVEKLNTYRITFTPPLINAAKTILFLVAGTDKADAVQAVLRGNYSPEDFPAQLIQPTQGVVVWLLDAEASAKIKGSIQNLSSEAV